MKVTDCFSIDASGLVDSFDNYFRDRLDFSIRHEITVSAASGDKNRNKSFCLYDYMCAGYGLDLSLDYIENHKYYEGVVVFIIEYDMSNIFNIKDKDDIILDKITKKLKLNKF
ncbi:hypothetical protein [Marinobacterium zhoushanense]|uniref:hypothetical protein n=1 Tax=Marinobacterium zhoushanense TaxID=1679163 RepID=UPI00166962FF|nr:hypothetical protein [Marinobacterium zhoushanense]